MTSPQRGEVRFVDLGLAVKVRPALVLSVPVEDTDRALVTLVPHTTSLRGSRFEVPRPVRFLRPGGFDAQSLCRFVLFGTPVLMHPSSEVVFGFAGGTHTYALRLPEPVRQEALAAGATRVKTYPRQPSLDLEVIGPEWVFCSWLTGEERWCLSAYEFAAGATSTTA